MSEGKKNQTVLIASVIAILLFSEITFPVTRATGGARIVHLNPIADAHVSSTEADANFGERDGLQVSDSRFAFLMFDLSTIPSGVVVRSASLRMVPTSDVKGAQIIGAHRCPDSTWTEFGITWNTAPSISPDATSTADIARGGTWYVWDVVSDVEEVVESADKKLTLVLRSEEEGKPEILFGSRESFRKQTAWERGYDNRPLLVISYARAASTMGCLITPSRVVIGQTVNVAGEISPLRGGVAVTLLYFRPDGSNLTRTVLTTGDGSYRDSYHPDKVGAWTVKASWAGDESHEGAESPIVPFTVVKAKSSITLSTSSETAIKGVGVKLSGSIAPPYENVTITLKYTKPDGTSLTRTVETDSTGNFGDAYPPDVIGSWIAVASWLGDERYEQAESSAVTFSVKGPSTVTLSVSSETITRGGNVTVSGSMGPHIGAEAEVTIEYRRPDGTVVQRAATTDSTGAFADTYVPDALGSWTVVASWEGDAEHVGASSGTVSITVEEPPNIWILVGELAFFVGLIGAPIFLVYRWGKRRIAKNCPDCGRKVSANWTYCPYCSTQLKPTNSEAS